MAAPLMALAPVIQGLADSVLNFLKPAQDTVVVYDLPQSNKGLNTVIFLALFVGVIFGLIYLFKR